MKRILAMAAVLVLGHVGPALAATDKNCCQPGAACCAPGAACCTIKATKAIEKTRVVVAKVQAKQATTTSCCTPGAACCTPGAACCPH